MGTSKLFGKANKLWGSDLLWTTIPSTGSGNTIVFVVVVVVVIIIIIII